MLTGSEQTALIPSSPEKRQLDQPKPSELLEKQGFVKPIPEFADQLADESRTNEITYIPGMRTAVEKSTDGYPTATTTEHAALTELADFLQEVAIKGTKLDRQQAASMLEHLSFVGKKEYNEAIKGLASYWRSILDSDEKIQICVIVGRIDPSKPKSDSFMLDNILREFDEAELAKYKDRIVTDPRGLTCDPQDARIVLLDDWPISGSQLRAASQSLSEDFPVFRDSIEVQAIAATPDKIDQGLSLTPSGNELADKQRTRVPIRPYYVVRPVSDDIAPKSGAHLTSYYSSVDYGFNRDIARMATNIEKDMPAGCTNIVRPYNNGEPLTQIARLGEPDYSPLPAKYSAVEDEIMS
jgi:hypothetical protein